jgi:hypothetical protein
MTESVVVISDIVLQDSGYAGNSLDVHPDESLTGLWDVTRDANLDLFVSNLP